MKHTYSSEYMNVSIKPLDQSEIEKLRTWRNDPRNTKYLNKIPYISVNMQEKWFSAYLENCNELTFSIHENEILKRMVGSLSLYDFSDQVCFFGKILIGDDEAHGMRIGTKATICALEVAFMKLKLNQVLLYVYTENIAAIKAYEGAGFTVIDTHSDINGNDEYTMAIDRKKWEELSHA